ncbi:ABC transporter substrate-binding protein [Paenibacillus sp. HB172176]|uniref:ABC transporter substrate-binding protein n=1 Tax=Paenibacillus sp. HB172176 TaxID=2493690 RepID=UPI00143A0091|nr:ABC transporter substrate-binding protein [Paenibacillus sp. HB172176]
MKNRNLRVVVWICVMVLFSAICLAACGNSNNSESAPSETAGATVNPSGQEETPTPSEESATRSYTDSKGHTVEIPTNPQRIVYTGSDLGDMLALGVKPVGAALGVIGDQIAYSDLIDGIEDVGDLLGDAEKVLSLNPDLILLDGGGTYYEESAYETLNKIAPTVTYERLATSERLLGLADIIGKRQEAEQWISDFEGEAAETIEKMGLQGGDTATVFLQLGTDLYVMGNKGFGTLLYETLGYEPAPQVKKELIDKGEAFINVSKELLAEFAGDEVFVLTDQDEAGRAASDSIFSTGTWNAIPAVQAGHVHYVATMWNFDDPITKERLLDMLQTIFQK